GDLRVPLVLAERPLGVAVVDLEVETALGGHLFGERPDLAELRNQHLGTMGHGSLLSRGATSLGPHRLMAVQHRDLPGNTLKGRPWTIPGSPSQPRVGRKTVAGAAGGF